MIWWTWESVAWERLENARLPVGMLTDVDIDRWDVEWWDVDVVGMLTDDDEMLMSLGWLMRCSRWKSGIFCSLRSVRQIHRTLTFVLRYFYFFKERSTKQKEVADSKLSNEWRAYCPNPIASIDSSSSYEINANKSKFLTTEKSDFSHRALSQRARRHSPPSEDLELSKTNQVDDYFDSTSAREWVHVVVG